MCTFMKDLGNKKILLIFFILALILLLPFCIVSLVLANEHTDDYCLSYAGMKYSGSDFTLRRWLQVDGFTRLAFLVIAIFFFVASKYLRDLYALVTVESAIFRIFYFFLIGWMIFGAVIFWGNIQKTAIFQQIPLQQYFQKDDNGKSFFPQKVYHNLSSVVNKNEADYYNWHRIERQNWYPQQFVNNWSSHKDNQSSIWNNYQETYTRNVDNQTKPIDGFRYGCKPRVSGYMWALLIINFILLPLALILLGLRSRQTDYEPDAVRGTVEYNLPNAHGAKGTYETYDAQGNRHFKAYPPTYPSERTLK